MLRTSGSAGLLVLVVWSWAIQFIEFYGPRIPGQELSFSFLTSERCHQY